LEICGAGNLASNLVSTMLVTGEDQDDITTKLRQALIYDTKEIILFAGRSTIINQEKNEKAINIFIRQVEQTLAVLDRVETINGKPRISMVIPPKMVNHMEAWHALGERLVSTLETVKEAKPIYLHQLGGPSSTSIHRRSSRENGSLRNWGPASRRCRLSMSWGWR